MSTLFNIRIELVIPPTVWARFEVTHPDQWDVPESKNFALMVVVEAYDNMKRGFGAPAELVATHPRREVLERWSELYRRFDGPAFVAEAARAIQDVELGNQQGNPRRAEGDPDPKATLAFTVSDPAVVSHLVGGVSFDSAMCDCRLW